MAVTSMRLVNVTGSLSRLGEVLEACCSGEDFQFEQAMSFFGDKSDFMPINDENPFSANLTRLKNALDEAGLTVLPCEQGALPQVTDWEQVGTYVEELSTQLRELGSDLTAARSGIEQTTLELEQLRHFTQLDVRLQDIFECEYIKVRFGRLPKESYSKLKYYSDNPYIMLMPCDTDKDYVWGMYLAPIDNIADVDRIFQSLLWERMHLPEATGTPAEECEAMEQRIVSFCNDETDAARGLNVFWKENRERCSSLYHLLDKSSSTFELRRYVAKYKDGDKFFLAGWVAASDAAAFSDRLGSIPHVECEVENPNTAEGHSPPVKLKNGFFSRPFEFYVSMYGLPDYHEADPTPFVAITYFILFGIMFADLGQGLILSLAGIIMWKWKGMALGRIIGICGISSAICGVLMGSVFGFEHWLDPFWQWVHEKTGVPLNEGKLINIEDSNVVNMLIYAAIGIGAALVICAMIIGIYSNLKQKHYGNALFGQNGLAGLIFYSSVVYAAVNMLVLGRNPLNLGFILLCIVLPLVLIFLREPLGELIEGKEHWLPENFLDFFMQNFFELFEVLLSYVSNTVSFLRVGAFILVHYGMMTVVFTLAEMPSKDGPLGIAPFIIIVVIGNIIITVLEGLLVGIQGLRLEFYEMFSRFYSGTGRPFTPARQLSK
ncbi:MAG: ATPase [Ruminococcaceae bacterium]|nr:ATPase [Oscillospiraceae bacterium]